MLDILSAGEFLQVHKSFVVAVGYIKSVQGNRIFLKQDHNIPIGKVYKMNVNGLFK
ncbi:MAG: LytTR family transcriptional regulator DNA-binding domain-containing protein [Balneola sp.]